MAMLILMSQNQSNRRAAERSHLDLQVNLLAEQEATAMLRLLRSLCLYHRMPEAKSPEVAELLRRTEPHALARELGLQLPLDGKSS